MMRYPSARPSLLALLLALLLGMGLAGCGSSAPEVAEPGPDFDREAFSVQGHRGARGLAPENTLPSFEIALDWGVDTLELDLHLSADDRLVIWHDPAVEGSKCRLDSDLAQPTAPDPAQAPVPIRSLTLAQLGQYRCDLNPDPGNFPDQQPVSTPLAQDRYALISLESLFDFVDAYAQSGDKTPAQRANAAQIRYNVETKRRPDQPQNIGDGFDGLSPGPFEQELVRVIEAYGLTERVTVQSFDHRSLWTVAQLNPQIELAALINQGISQRQLAELQQRGAGILSPRFTLVNERLLAQAHELGLQVIPWTVNDPAEMARLMALGVDGLITDFPDRLMGLLQER
jgi:glycerophosphoryl diester phosphodiesterase